MLQAAPPTCYLSLHDALPISSRRGLFSMKNATWSPRCSPWSRNRCAAWLAAASNSANVSVAPVLRSEEHTSELQSQSNLVCRLLLEKKKLEIIAAQGTDRGLT